MSTITSSEHLKPPEIVLFEDSGETAEIYHKAVGRFGLPLRLHVLPSASPSFCADALRGFHPSLIFINPVLLNCNSGLLLGQIKGQDEFRRVPVIFAGDFENTEDAQAFYGLGANCCMRLFGDENEKMGALMSALYFWLVISQLSDRPPHDLSPGSVLVPVPAGKTGSGRVIHFLLVEDNPGDVRLTREAISDCGINGRLDVIADGSAVFGYLERLKELPGRNLPDLILLDLNIPKMDGRGVLGQIKRSVPFSRIPVLVLTTSASEKDIRTAYDLCANCYILKPIDLDQCIRIFQAINTFWCTHAVLSEGD